MNDSVKGAIRVVGWGTLPGSARVAGIWVADIAIGREATLMTLNPGGNTRDVTTATAAIGVALPGGRNVSHMRSCRKEASI